MRPRLVIGALIGLLGCAVSDDAFAFTPTGQLATRQIMPFPGGPLAGAAAAWSSKDSSLFVFGGTRGVTEGHDSVSSELWKYHVASNNWSLVHEGTGPGPRFGASAVYVNGSGFILAGGRNAQEPCVDSLWTFEPASEVWAEMTRPEIGALFPLSDAGLVAEASGRLWYGFGSCGSITTNATYYRSPGVSEFVRIARTIDPHPRSGQVFAFDTRRKAILTYGGTYGYGLGVERGPVGTLAGGDDCGQRPALIEMWSMDVESRSWTRLFRAGDGFFQERAFALGAYSPASDALIVVGGVQNGYGCDDYYRPSVGTPLGTVAAFSLRDGRWQEYQLAVDLRRTRMAGAYSPGLGEFVVSGGDSMLSAAADGLPVSTGYAIQIEQSPRVLLRGKIIGSAGHVRIDLEFDRANPNLVSLGLLNVDTGEVKPLEAFMKRRGTREWSLLVSRSSAKDLASDPLLRLVGGFEGEVLGFLGQPIERRTKSDSPLVPGLLSEGGPVPIGTLRFLDSRIDLREQPREGSRLEFVLFDVAGRRVAAGHGNVVRDMKPHVYRLSVHDPIYKGSTSGVYFVRFTDNKGMVMGSGRVFLR